MNGILLINKEKDYTSRDVVNIVSKALNIKKVGHAGTLDPLATGVLVLGINEGTKILSFLTDDVKEYIATGMIGIKTDTLDITGEVTNTGVKTVSKEDLINCLKKFVGKIVQETPKYSAVKIRGKHLYNYARENIDIELPKREIEIKRIELLNFYTLNDNSYFVIKCLVSKGTYIRTLIDDIGTSLNTYATMTDLIRTKQGIFNIDDCLLTKDITLDNIISLEKALENYPKIIVDGPKELAILNGQLLDKVNNNKYNFYYNKNLKLIAIYEDYKKDVTKIKPFKVFN
ncbi:MAG: tRNA pseudouridine(55) synthase TruB [Bacilli bacterium]